MITKTLNKGFTLIELLVVISIISLLSSIVLTSLVSAKEKAQVTQIFQTMNGLKIAAELYYQDNGSYPTNFNDSSLEPYVSGDWKEVLTEPIYTSSLSSSVSCGEGTSAGGNTIYYLAPLGIDFGNVNYYNSSSGTFSGSTSITHNGRAAQATANLPCVYQR